MDKKTGPCGNHNLSFFARYDTPGRVVKLHLEKARGMGVCGQGRRKKDEKNFKNRVKKACFLRFAGV
ncbi:MAG: hypothetical protein IK099_15235 [Clostridia bacterium]|nr:hypothetical protein [Clostridia bacterium]